MLQDMDYMKASCVIYVKFRTFNQLKCRKICVLTVISFRIVTLSVRYDLIVRVCFV